MSRDDIIATVAQLGFQNFSVPALARTLGVDHSTLYRYIDGRDDLVVAAMERCFAQNAWPPAENGDWSETVRAYGRAYSRLYAEHPGLAWALGNISRRVNASVETMNLFRTALVDRGVAPYEALLLSDMLAQLVRGVYGLWHDDTNSGVTLVERNAALLSRFERTASGADPRVVEALWDFTSEDVEAQLEKRVEILIAGFRPLVEATGTRPL
ncbi:MAG: TetR family transcriptional regulator [Microbacterium sp.]